MTKDSFFHVLHKKQDQVVSFSLVTYYPFVKFKLNLPIFDDWMTKKLKPI